MVKIEIASKLNIIDIERLYTQLFDVLAELQPYNFKPAHQERNFIESVFEDEKSDVIIAKQGDLVVGFILIKEQSTPPYNCLIERKLAYIMDIVVDNNYRGKGIGKQLMKEAENWAILQKLDYLELAVLNENISARGLYEELGFADTIRTMGKRLK